MKRLIALVITIAALGTACEGNVFELSVGDCFNDPNGTEVFDVEMVDCGQMHDNEVYATYELPDGAYPGDNAIWDDADRQCLDRFSGYVGRDYQTSALDFGALTPTNESWSQGDREVVCFLYDLNGSRLNLSARNSGI